MSSLRRWFPFVWVFAQILLLTSPSLCQAPTPVLTWHNDMQRTGRQLSETILTPSSVPGHFGLIWQYNVSPTIPITGSIYAQPLVATSVSATNCPHTWPCNVVFVATEKDMLYAFDADSNTWFWTTNLAAMIPNGGTYDDCRNWPNSCDNGYVIYPYFGVTGTPVIDPNAGILYVVSLVVDIAGSYPGNRHYWLHAIDITNGLEKLNSPIQINGSVSGPSTLPQNVCQQGTGTGGTVTFDPTHHLQRAGLLLLHLNDGSPVVYIAFTPIIGEQQNGWIFGYKYTSSGFAQVAQFNTTPFGTGGGIWGAGGALASDGDNIYVATGNGTFNANSQTAPNTDYGESVIKLTANHTTGVLNVADYFTPYDALSFQGPQYAGRCKNDVDLGSGGLMVFPDSFFNGYPNMLVFGDKESYLTVLSRDTLGHFNPNCVPGNCQTPNFIQQSILPPNPPPDVAQGYMSSPAYWKYVDGQNQPHYFLYYSSEVGNQQKAPNPLDQYELATPGSSVPIPNAPTHRTNTKFCEHGTTPSISANVATGGIVWAIERNNFDSPRDCLSGDQNANWNYPAILHAYDATDISSNSGNGIYISGHTHIRGVGANFSTPTIFHGRVYMGTLGLSPDGSTGEVDVFGLCGGQGQPQCLD